MVPQKVWGTTHKTFWAITKKRENRNLTYFYFDNFLKRSAWNFTPAWVSFQILVTILLIRCCHRNCTTAMVKSTVTALNRRIYYGNFVLLLVSRIRWFWSQLQFFLYCGIKINRFLRIFFFEGLKKTIPDEVRLPPITNFRPIFYKLLVLRFFTYF